MNLTYSFTQKSKRNAFILMGIGVLAIVLGFMTDHSEHHSRFWANMLVNSFFFLGISVLAIFFLAVQYAAEAHWSVVLKRVFEAIMAYVPIGVGLMLLVLLAGSLHGHHLYHWMDASLYDEFLPDGSKNPNFDHIIAGKKAFLNQPFFWIRAIGYSALWILFARGFRKRSLEEDLVGGTEIHFKNVRKSAIFLVLFGFTSVVTIWDWIMSIDTHWFSTLFAWYVFSGMWISFIITSILVVYHLKGRGYLENVNENHIHDLGKWMFAISFLWSYLWFAQFMLIWYSNIPEEVTYYMQRWEQYKFLFWIIFIINFTIPMIMLMSRDSKRNRSFLLIVGYIIAIGHWLDTYLLVMPGTVGGEWHLGWMEIGMALGFLGLFIFIVLSALTKAPLQVQKHPYLEESLHQEV